MAAFSWLGGLRLGMLLALLTLSGPALAQPTFSKAFAPSTIGPGSTSTLTFTITNADGSPVTDLAFTDNLPMGVALATPAHGVSTCGGTLTAPDGGTVITLADGAMGANSACTVSVDVTSSAVGTHMNVSGELTSSAGNSGTASADLTVVGDRPGFSKSFSPSSVLLGGRSTLTFTIDNTSNAAPVQSLSFADSLPAGMVVADPSNASSDCVAAMTPNTVINALPGTGSIAVTATGQVIPPVSIDDPVLGAMSSCTVAVDVIVTALGAWDNVSGELTSTAQFGAQTLSSGKASATLTVTGADLVVTKSFVDDPVNPGGTVGVQFTIQNRSRSFDATGISFTDDLDATLSGLVATGLPLTDPCGPGSTFSGPSLLSLTGASVPAGGSCSFTATLQVPAMAGAGVYLNTTSAITATLGGASFMGSPATDSLTVNDAPLLTKTFLTDPVGAGDTVMLQFTITNTSSTSSATNIAFEDDLSIFSAVSVSPPAIGFCGAGSFGAYSGSTGILSIVGANLAPSDSCTFSVDLQLPAGTPPGTYTNTTTAISATVDMTTQTGHAASDTLTVVRAPQLRKSFTDAPVLPGGTVTLEFTLTHDASAPSDATGITFTDDLDATLTGLVAIGLPMSDVCGSGSTLTGTSSLTLSGGALAPGASCTFSVTLQVPAAATAGIHKNTTSDVTATVGGVTAIASAASDNLTVAGLMLTKSFTDDPALPGGTVTLEFTLDNTSGTQNAANIGFTDNLALLDTSISGWNVSGVPMTACGGTPSLSGPSNVLFSGGSVMAGDSCSFSVTVAVPAAAPSGSYGNTTSAVTADIGTATGVVLPAAADVLEVSDLRLQLTKTFTDDPVAPGATVTLELTLTNLDASQMVSGITFTDDLDAAFSGLAAIGTPLMDVCGTGSMLAGTSMLALSGGNLAGGGSCTFSVTLQVPAAVSLGTTATNTTSGVSGMLGGLPVTGDPASDVLQINTLSFTKSFDGLTVAGGSPVLSFTVENLDAVNGVSSLGFTDDLGTVLPGLVAVGLPASNVCGTGSQLSGTSFLTLSGGNLAPGGSCTIMVTLQVPSGATPGSYPNTTSELLSAGISVSTPATAILTVEPPPTFAKGFAPSSIAVGQVSTLTFTIDNTASAVAASSLDFTDNLPAGLVVASPPNGSTTCTGGTLTAVAGTAVVTYTGGTVAAGASCTVSADVSGTTAGDQANTTGDLTSSSGTSGTAGATLHVSPNPGFSKSFAPNPVAIGQPSTLSFTIDNTGSTADATGLDLTDNLPSGLLVATPANESTTCTGGTLTATAGSGVVSYSGGGVSAISSCTVQVDVVADAGGDYDNTAGPLTSSLGDSGTATDTLRVSGGPTFAKDFAPSVIPAGGVSTLSFTIDNGAGLLDATGLDFTDALPASVVIATPAKASTSCTGGTLSAPAGGTTVSYTGGAVAAGASCVVQLDVTSTAPGDHLNTTGDLTSSLGNSGSASATLSVAGALGFAKAFSPNPGLTQAAIALIFTIDNTASGLGATNLSFSDTLPSGLIIATPPNASTSCAGGTLGAPAGGTTISYTGGTVAAGASCTIQVDVTTRTPGQYLNASGDLTSSLGNSGGATATLVVEPGGIPTLDRLGLLLLAIALVSVGYWRLRRHD